MARGVQLGQLVQDLRAELGQSLRVSVGVDNKPQLEAVLRRTQELLYDEYEWDHMSRFGSKQLAAGQQYYDFPTGLADTTIVKAAIRWSTGQHPIPIERGIDFDEYASYDSGLDARADPVQRWEVRSTAAGVTQFEVWPIPASDTQTVVFKGKQILRPLVAENDVCDLDSVLIVLSAAGQLLARQKSEDANDVKAAAQRRLVSLRSKGADGRAPIVMGGGDTYAPKRRGVVIQVA